MVRVAKPEFRVVAATEILGICSSVRQIAESTSKLIYQSSVATLSDSALEQLSYQHPVHLIRTGLGYEIFAGLRTYQLVISRKVNASVPALVYSEPSKPFMQEMAATEMLGSRLMHSLGTKPANQLARIIRDLGSVETDRIAPTLTSDRAIIRSQKYLE